MEGSNGAAININRDLERKQVSRCWLGGFSILLHHVTAVTWLAGETSQSKQAHWQHRSDQGPGEPGSRQML